MSKSSASVKANFSPDKKQGGVNLDINGRATSVLGKSQGDHVTAYGLVEAGFSRIIGSLSKVEVNELFKLENRNSLRTKRGRVYDFISCIAILNDDHAKSLYLGIDEILKGYNKSRVLKTKLREKTRGFQDDPHIIGENLQAVLSSIEAQYEKNGELIRESLLEMVKLVMTFYNHIPHTAYFAIEGFEAGGQEGSQIRTTLPKIENIIRESRLVVPGSPVLTVKLNTELLPAIASLIHYPEITDCEYKEKDFKTGEEVVIRRSAKEILGVHRARTLQDGAKRTAKARDNEPQNLVEALAKHLHIIFAVYPELETIFDVQQVINSFVARIIAGKDDRGRLGWPSFNNQPAINSIAQHVTVKVIALKQNSIAKHYTSYKEYGELVSSDDEEEPTKPRTKPKPESAVKLESKKEDLSLSEDERRELEMLRKYKAIIEAEVDLSRAVKEKLKKEVPGLYLAKEGEGRS